MRADSAVANADCLASGPRRQRSDDWYIGSVTDENARTLNVRLDFLDADCDYVAQIYRDGEGADWKTNPHAITIREAHREGR